MFATAATPKPYNWNTFATICMSKGYPNQDQKIIDWIQQISVFQNVEQKKNMNWDG